MADKWTEKKKKCVRDSVKSFRSIGWVGLLWKSLRFSVGPTRVLPFILSDIAAFLVVLLIANQSTLLLTLISYTEGTIPAESIYMLAGVMAVFALWFVVNLWLTGAVVYQSKHHDKYKESWKLASRRLHSLILAAVVVFAISLAFSVVPYIGALLGVIVALAFLFMNQFIMLENTGFVKALAGSAKTFKGKIINVFAAWVFSQFFTTVIMFVFLIPMILFSLSVDPSRGSEDILINSFLMADSTMLVVMAAFFFVGMSISRVFSIKFLTEIFLQLKKKKWLIS